MSYMALFDYKGSRFIGIDLAGSRFISGPVNVLEIRIQILIIYINGRQGLTVPPPPCQDKLAVDITPPHSADRA
jgi:hypothetical protein